MFSLKHFQQEEHFSSMPPGKNSEKTALQNWTSLNQVNIALIFFSVSFDAWSQKKHCRVRKDYPVAFVNSIQNTLHNSDQKINGFIRTLNT